MGILTLLLTIILYIVALFLFIKLCVDVSCIKKQVGKGQETAFYYIQKGLACLNDAQENAEQRVAYCDYAVRYLKIAECYRVNGHLGTVPRHIFSKYDGTGDFSDFVQAYIRERIAQAKQLRERQ